MNDGTSFQQADKPILCANGCGFFGTAAMMNLCSKCYRDHHLKEEQAASAKAAFEKSLSTLPPTIVVAEKLVEAVGPSSKVELASPVDQRAPAPSKPRNKCETCNKKVGVMGFKCKCGSTFCGSHRLAEAHGCTFDFKGAGRDAIAKANPIIKPDKLQRF